MLAIRRTGKYLENPDSSENLHSSLSSAIGNVHGHGTDRISEQSDQGICMSNTDKLFGTPLILLSRSLLVDWRDKIRLK